MGGAELSDIEQLAAEVMRLWRAGRQIRPFSDRPGGLDFSTAYEVVNLVRDTRVGQGELTVGRKIGFTNQAIWSDYDISSPIWNYLFDSTVVYGAPDLDLTGMPEPRIEPEVVLHLARAPVAGMDEAALAACVDWVAPAFEIVFSVFPGWRFQAADAAAAFGVHGALVLGDRLELSEAVGHRLVNLSEFTVTMQSDRGTTRMGRAANVLGGPVQALAFLVEELSRRQGCAPLSAGEIVTTGTLTEAMPAVVGETWTTRFEGIALKPMRLTLR